MVPYTALENLHLTVEIFDTTSRKMIETVADIHHPVMVNNESIWWGRSCYLPTPLNFMKPSCIVVIRVRGSRESFNDTEDEQIVVDLGWTYLNLDLTCIDTKMLRLQLFSGAFDYNLVAFNTASVIGTYIDLDFSLTSRVSQRPDSMQGVTSTNSVTRGARRRYTVAPTALSATAAAAAASASGSGKTPRAVVGDSTSAAFGSSVVGENRSVLQSPIRVPIPANPADVTPPRVPSDPDSTLPRGRFVAFADTTESSKQSLPSKATVGLTHGSKSTRKVINSVSGRHLLSEREAREKGYIKIYTREFVDNSLDEPVLFLMRVPDGVGPGTVIVNLGGRKDRSLVLPRGVVAGQTVLVVAKK